MFGYVTASLKELDPEQKLRYQSVYCGICRRIRTQSGELARLGLSYDMAFLAILLMSLYEPQETAGKNPCLTHPVTKRPWVDSEAVQYAADMNVALCYYKCLDDWADDRKAGAKAMGKALAKRLPPIAAQYPRQCQAIKYAVETLAQLEKDKCANPDLPAGVFGELMGELLVLKEDLWASTLRQMGMALGRFIYLLDAALDYDKDEKKGRYNPYLAMGTGKDWDRWEEYLVLIMGRCTQFYEMLPLVQDKGLLDNILYSGIWINYRGKRKGENP